MNTLSDLRESLLFLHVAELRAIAIKLDLLSKGSKMDLILRILHFVQTGVKGTSSKFPSCSYAKRGDSYPLTLTTPMLKGSYKNDLKTRLFFKKVIGQHFHFTAFGIDWLHERWMRGHPPTYQEFALMWEMEYRKRQEIKAPAKEEWAYIRFVQNYVRLFPGSSHDLINASWEQERIRHKDKIHSLLHLPKEFSP